MQVAAFVEGQIVVWKPLPGLDPSLGERALQIGATAYGIALSSGKSESEAQQDAERAMYQSVFRVKY